MADPRDSSAHPPGSDDAVRAAYRGLPRDEPPAALDDALRAAARRAVGARPRAAAARFRRWSGPVALAAVVVLAVSVSLHIEDEGVVIDPAGGRPEALRREPARLAPVAEPKRAERAPAEAVQAPAAPPARSAPPPPVEERGKSAPADAMRAAKKPSFVPDAGDDRTTGKAEAARALSERAGASALSGAPAAAGAAGRASGAAPPQAAPLRKQLRAATPPESPRAWLERIVRLRGEGKDEAADEELEKFRRRHPDYEIPRELRDAVLGKR